MREQWSPHSDNELWLLQGIADQDAIDNEIADICYSARCEFNEKVEQERDAWLDPENNYRPDHRSAWRPS